MTVAIEARLSQVDFRRVHSGVRFATRVRSVLSMVLSKTMRGCDPLAGGVLTLTVAEPDLVVSAALVAVTTNEPAVVPAVYNPAVLIDPPVAVHVTAVLLAPVTVAENCCVPPVKTEAGFGETLTDTAGAAVMVTAAVADLLVS